ncbi:hypothetical protein [Sphingomonas aerolata]|uniref:hypothetical protein n=1 Tax=Sphingomonas aerolata TaxID=185951 RepID=UPI002FE290F8
MRLIPRSIHGRMLGLSLLATLVALAVAGAAIAGVLQRFVTQGLDQRLDAELSLLAGAVDGDGRDRPGATDTASWPARCRPRLAMADQ